MSSQRLALRCRQSRLSTHRERRNIVIEAGAGTGKTTAIVAEVLKLMLGDEDARRRSGSSSSRSPKKRRARSPIAFTQALTELESAIRLPAKAFRWPIGSPRPLFEVP